MKTANPAKLNIPAPSGSLPSRSTPGLHRLGLETRRDALLYVPESMPASRAPLVISLHGAGGNAQHGIDLLRWLADQRGFALLAPPSRRETWDVIVGGYGPDVRFVERAVEETYRRCPVDPSAIAIAGFSDGASYALSLGLANGTFFRTIIAYSPGFMAPPLTEGDPQIFVSHGTRDQVLPIEQCSRTIVPRLKRAGRRVVYREFDGGHTIPGDVAAQGMDVFLSGIASRTGTEE